MRSWIPELWGIDDKGGVEMIWPFARRKFTCPCCGYKTLDSISPGSHLICEICFWEDDPVQFEDPDFEGGANAVSLRQAQRNFATIGCVEKRFLDHVRPPSGKDRHNLDWRQLDKDEAG